MSSFSTAVTDITAKVASLLFVFSRSIGHALSHGLKRRHRPFPSIWHSMAARSCDHLDFFSIFWPASLKDQLNSSDGIVNYRSPSRSELLILVASEWSHLSFSFTFDGLLSPRPENPAIICIRSFNCPILIKLPFPAGKVWGYQMANSLYQSLLTEALERMVRRLIHVPWRGFMLRFMLLLWWYHGSVCTVLIPAVFEQNPDSRENSKLVVVWR